METNERPPWKDALERLDQLLRVEAEIEERRARATERGKARLSVVQKLALTVLVLALFAVLVGRVTWSAFSGTTSNASNSFAAGTVTITDNDSGTAMFAVSDMTPGSTDTSCIVVTYTGSLPAAVRLYGTTTGTGLDAYLDVTVTRGTIASPTFDSCVGFSADATDYIGSGVGVIYTGTLAAYPDSWAAGQADPTAGSPESWTTSEAHAYRFVVTLQDNNSAQGLNATQAFTWEARNT